MLDDFRDLFDGGFGLSFFNRLNFRLDCRRGQLSQPRLRFGALGDAGFRVSLDFRGCGLSHCRCMLRHWFDPCLFRCCHFRLFSVSMVLGGLSRRRMMFNQAGRSRRCSLFLLGVVHFTYLRGDVVVQRIRGDAHIYTHPASIFDNLLALQLQFLCQIVDSDLTH